MVDAPRSAGSVPWACEESVQQPRLYLPPTPSLFGNLGRVEGPRVTAESTRMFLDDALGGTSAGIENRLTEFGDVTVYP